MSHSRASDALLARVGEEIHISDWLLIDQARINAFADVTGDHQFIHVDPDAAAQTPLGGAVAHGFMVLSLLPHLSEGADLAIEGAAFGLNYGLDRVRMTAPVRVGARVRGRFRLAEVTERAPGQWMVVQDVTVEIEGEPKPALVAQWRILMVGA